MNWKMSDTINVQQNWVIYHWYCKNSQFLDSAFYIVDIDIWKKSQIHDNNTNSLIKDSLWRPMSKFSRHFFHDSYKATNTKKKTPSMYKYTCFIQEALDIGIYIIFNSKLINILLCFFIIDQHFHRGSWNQSLLLKKEKRL